MPPLAGSAPSNLPPARSLRLVMHGAAGRMGQRIIACAAAEPAAWTLVGAIDREGHPKSGVDAGDRWSERVGSGSVDGGRHYGSRVSAKVSMMRAMRAGSTKGPK